MNQPIIPIIPLYYELSERTKRDAMDEMRLNLNDQRSRERDNITKEIRSHFYHREI